MKTSDARSSRSCGETAIDRDVDVCWTTCTTRPKKRSTKSSHACGCRARQRCKSCRSISESATRGPFQSPRKKPQGEACNKVANESAATWKLDRAKHRNFPYFTLTQAASQA